MYKWRNQFFGQKWFIYFKIWQISLHCTEGLINKKNNCGIQYMWWKKKSKNQHSIFTFKIYYLKEFEDYETQVKSKRKNLKIQIVLSFFEKKNCK